MGERLNAKLQNFVEHFDQAILSRTVDDRLNVLDTVALSV